jgi:sugar phosphate isomerase/epimerase
MTSRERILAAWSGSGYDHPPLSAWCFGFLAPPHLRWRRDGREVRRWYTLRLEHLHTLPVPWDLEDDFRRVLAWQSLGLDDLLEVSVPWGTDPRASWRDAELPPGGGEACPVLVREYATPSGPLRHAVRRTGEDPGEGWVVQPACVPLFEDYNIPRAVQPLVRGPEQVPAVAHLYREPGSGDQQAFRDRLRRVGAFAREHGVAVQAWSAFGMDAVVWFMGVEGAIFLAMDQPEAFAELFRIVSRADAGRTELAAADPGVDLVVERGWYSSTDFWSPPLLDRHLFPHVAELAAIAHRHGKKFAYVMTTGVAALGQRLIESGVDVLYFVDPAQDGLEAEKARELFGGRITLAGGLNSTTLLGSTPAAIRRGVHRALDALAGTGRFILQPVDALHPDTPWEGMEAVIEAWSQWR